MLKKRIQFVGEADITNKEAKVILEEGWKMFDLMGKVIKGEIELEELVKFSIANPILSVHLESWVKKQNVHV